MDKFTSLAEFDGSVIAERTAGEVPARCHDEPANMLALNLMHDIVTGAKPVPQARDYYAKEFADYRRKQPTPYMERLHFTPATRAPATPTSACCRTRSSNGPPRKAKRGRKRSGKSLNDDYRDKNDRQGVNLPVVLRLSCV